MVFSSVLVLAAFLTANRKTTAQQPTTSTTGLLWLLCSFGVGGDTPTAPPFIARGGAVEAARGGWVKAPAGGGGRQCAGKNFFVICIDKKGNLCYSGGSAIGGRNLWTTYRF